MHINAKVHRQVGKENEIISTEIPWILKRVGI